MQSQRVSAEQKSEMTSFELICLAAETQDDYLLQSACTQASLYVYSPEKGMSTLAYLALRKKIDAIQFLVKRGVPKYLASQVFAMIGEVELAFTYLEESIQDNPNKLDFAIHAAAQGFGHCRDITQRDDFLTWVKHKYSDHYSTAMIGMALGISYIGKPAELDAFLLVVEKGVDSLPIKMIIKQLSLGLQLSRRAEEISWFLTKIKQKYPACYQYALWGQARGYAAQGRVEELELALKSLKSATPVEESAEYHKESASIGMYVGIFGSSDRIEKFLEGALRDPDGLFSSVFQMISFGLGLGGHKAQAAWFRLYTARRYPDYLPEVLVEWATGMESAAGAADIEELIETVHCEYPPVPEQASPSKNVFASLLSAIIFRRTPSEACHWLSVILQDANVTNKLELLQLTATLLTIRTEQYAAFHVFLDYVKNNHAPDLARILKGMTTELGRQGNQVRIAAFMKCIRLHHKQHVPGVLGTLAKVEYNLNGCTSQALVLKTLTLMGSKSESANEDARYRLASDLLLRVRSSYSAGQVLRQANRLAKGKRELSLSYNQLQAWLQVEIRCLLLYGMVYRDSTASHKSRLEALPDDLLLNIVRFLAPLSLSWRSVDDLALKLSAAFSGLLHFGQPKGRAHQLLAVEEKPTPLLSLRPAGCASRDS